jgi:threonine/homoserine/homoserine lactone efflux protein
VLAALLAFAAFAAVVTVTPGLDTMLVVRTAAVAGRAPALAAAAGVMSGCLGWAVAGALGITAVLTASELAYDVLRWTGAVYLCFLGVRALWRQRRAAGAEPAGGAPPAHRSIVAAFRVGLVTNLLNPKVGVFYLAVLPQFLPRGVAPLPASLAMALVHDAEGLVWFAMITFLVGRVAPVFSRAAVRRRLDQLTGLVFIGFALRLAFGHAGHRPAA